LEAPVLLRARAEFPFLTLWLIASCLLITPGAWLGLAGGLVAFAGWARPSSAGGGPGWLFLLYPAAAGGPAPGGAIWLGGWWGLVPALGLYAFALLLVWIVLEFRYQLRLADAPPQTTDDWVYYYYS